MSTPNFGQGGGSSIDTTMEDFYLQRKGRMAHRKVSKVSRGLVRPDKKRCQAEKPNGHSFMTLGGVPARERCKDKPVYIATEKRPNGDGKIGSMSLCEACAKVMVKQLGNDYADLRRI